MAEISMLVGKKDAGRGNVVRIPGRFKQFLATLEGAEDYEEAVVTIYATPDGNPARGVQVASLTINAVDSGDISPIVECLCANYYAVIESITGGEVWLTGVNEDV